MSSTIDMTKGVYRRIYAGARTGRRINSVSIGAEFWFWRLHMIADDFGNGIGEPDLCRTEAAGLRKVTRFQVEGWMQELVAIRLIEMYAVGGDCYFHILDFEKFQPAGRNGKRIQKYPPKGNPDLSRIIRIDRVDPLHAHSESESDTHSESESHTEAKPAAASFWAIAETILPAPMQTERMKAAWHEWEAYRQERKPKVSERSARMTFSKLKEMTHDNAIAAIEHSIASGYQGIFEPTGRGAFAGGNSSPARVRAAPGKYARFDAPPTAPAATRDDGTADHS